MTDTYPGSVDSPDYVPQEGWPFTTEAGFASGYVWDIVPCRKSDKLRIGEVDFDDKLHADEVEGFFDPSVPSIPQSAPSAYDFSVGPATQAGSANHSLYIKTPVASAFIGGTRWGTPVFRITRTRGGVVTVWSSDATLADDGYEFAHVPTLVAGWVQLRTTAGAILVTELAISDGSVFTAEFRQGTPAPPLAGVVGFRVIDNAEFSVRTKAGKNLKLTAGAARQDYPCGITHHLRDSSSTNLLAYVLPYV